MRKNTEKELRAALRAAEAELAVATKLSAVNAAARKLMRAKEALKRLQGEPAKSALGDARVRARITPEAAGTRPGALENSGKRSAGQRCLLCAY